MAARLARTGITPEKSQAIKNPAEAGLVVGHPWPGVGYVFKNIHPVLGCLYITATSMYLLTACMA
ncbi:MAG: hypothetical protein ACO22A_07600, partial [Schleiferiaceae bacterium]